MSKSEPRFIVPTTFFELPLSKDARPFFKEPLVPHFAISPVYAHDVSVGWGRKQSGQKATQIAKKLGLPCLLLEDGFLRSYGIGVLYRPLSLVIDNVGIYYDSTSPSALENLLNSDENLTRGIESEVQRAWNLICEHRLSKYNHAPVLATDAVRANDLNRVLVVDQTAGDMSVTLGGADDETFQTMLRAALAENPDATIYVKTHPEVSMGHKQGYLASIQDDNRIVVLRNPVNPMSLIEKMSRVYVVSSTMGFEALIMGKPVTCFGLPWYAGWGATDDRLVCARRVRPRAVAELFAAAYFHYARYLNPVTHQQGTIFDVIEWLVLQRKMAIKFFSP